MGATQVSLAAVQNILMMNLKLEKLILPNHLTCCLCQFKDNIEVVYKTVKLRCDNECLTSNTHCDKEYISNMDGEFMKALQARKKSPSTELTIEPEKASSERNSLSYFRHEQLDNSHKRDMLARLDSMMSLLQVGDIDAESTLLSFIKVLFKDVQDGVNPLDPWKSGTLSISVQPESNDEIYNKVKKIHFLQSLINTEIQETIHKVRKKEKTATQVRSSLFGPKFKRQFFPKKLETVGPPKKKHLGKVQEWETQPLQGSNMFKDPGDLHKGHSKEEGTALSQRRGKAWSVAGNIAQERRLGQLGPDRLKDFGLAGRPRKVVGNSFNEESSFIQEHRAPMPLEQHSMGSPSAAAASQVPPEEQNPSADLTRTLRVLEDAGARARDMKRPSPVPHPGKRYLFRKLDSELGRRRPYARMNLETKEAAPQRPGLAGGPPLQGAVKGLVTSPPREESLSWRHQHKRVLDPFLSLRSGREEKTAESTRAPNRGHARSVVPPGKTAAVQSTGPEEREELEDSLLPAVRQPNEMQWEYHKVATDIDSPPQKPDPGDQLEMQLVQKLRPLIPNSNVRKFIAKVIRTLKMDCSDPRVHLECAKVLQQTGLLMKLLSERQDAKVSSSSEWDSDQGEAEHYINENTEGQGEQKQPEASELIKVPGYVVYHNQKAVVAIYVAIVVIILAVILCLIEIYSYRARQCKDGRSRELREVVKTAPRTPKEKAAKETKTAKTPKTHKAQGTRAPQRPPPPIAPLAGQTSEPPHGSVEPQNPQSPHSIGSSQPVATRQSVRAPKSPDAQQSFRSQEVPSSPEISVQSDE